MHHLTNNIRERSLLRNVNYDAINSSLTEFVRTLILPAIMQADRLVLGRWREKCRKRLAIAKEERRIAGASVAPNDDSDGRSKVAAQRAVTSRTAEIQVASEFLNRDIFANLSQHLRF